MKHPIPVAILALSTLASLSAPRAQAQASPTASRSLELSVFGGASGVYTGFHGGKNLSLTAGVDLGVRSFFGLRPFLEVRGTYPVHSGSEDSQKDVLGGLKLAKYFGRVHPYADILFGRGALTYINGAIDPSGSIEYLENPTNVLSPGVGVDFALTENFDLKADAQYQRFNTPVTASGTLYAKPLTLAIVYRPTFHRIHHGR